MLRSHTHWPPPFLWQGPAKEGTSRATPCPPRWSAQGQPSALSKVNPPLILPCSSETDARLRLLFPFHAYKMQHIPSASLCHDKASALKPQRFSACKAGQQLTNIKGSFFGRKIVPFIFFPISHKPTLPPLHEDKQNYLNKTSTKLNNQNFSISPPAPCYTDIY